MSITARASRALALTSLVVLSSPLGLARPARAADLSVEAAASTAPEGLGEGAVNGLYPLWEQTAVLHPAGTVAIGYEHAQVGLGRLQLGTNPLLDLHGTLNLEAKAALWRGPRLAVALLVSGYHLPVAAEGRTIGNLYASGFTNSYAPVWLVPISLAKSLRLGQRLALHWSSTLLLSQSPAPELRYLAGGQTVMLEAAANRQWTVRLHGGAEGWPVQTVAHAGLSFAYTAKYLYAALGAARKFSFEGESANVVMFDAGLLLR
jgi:hypothetical protein